MRLTACSKATFLRLMDMIEFKDIKQETGELSVLFVDDNDSLRQNAAKLFGKLFKEVILAADGVEALALYKKHNPALLITDIKMLKMDGLELSRKVRQHNPDAMIFIMSAYDEKENLMEAIRCGVFRFLKKPVNLNELAEALGDAVTMMRQRGERHLFDSFIETIFHYQSAMLVMYEKSRVVLANESFLDHVGVSSVEELIEKRIDIGRDFVEEDGFLHSTLEQSWITLISQTPHKLYHVKCKRGSSVRHLIAKYEPLPLKAGYGVVSFDDITELNLLHYFGAREDQNDSIVEDNEALIDLLRVLERNGAKVELHNYYKGLSITNDAQIASAGHDLLVLKTKYLQQKAIQYEQKSIVVSEALPHAIMCEGLERLLFEKQEVGFKNIFFVKTSPVMRKTIRVIPEENHTVTLFIKEGKFHGEVRIADISLDAVRLRLNALPAGLGEEDEVRIDMVLMVDEKPLIINTKARLFKKRETRYSFELLFEFLFEAGQRSELVKYITKRQMSLIRELKGMQNG